MPTNACPTSPPQSTNRCRGAGRSRASRCLPHGRSVTRFVIAVSVLLTIVVTMAQIGCATPQGPLFASIDPPLVWPAPPDVPRIRFVGQIADSSELHAGRSSKEGLLAALRGPRPPIRFSSPHAIAIGEGSLLAVADAGGGAVHILNLADRTHVLTLGSKDRPFATPVGVAWVGSRLFVTDARRGDVVELNAAGRQVGVFGEDALARPVGIAYIAQRNELVVVDGENHRLVFFNPDGRRLREMGVRGSGPGMFNFPTHVGFARGVLVVADTGNFRVQLFDADGHWIRSIGKKGDGAGNFSLPKGVAMDGEGHVYVVDAQFENIQVFDLEGRLLMALGEEGRGLGQFWLPVGVAIDAEDRIWIADSGNSRIQVFQYLGAAS